MQEELEHTTTLPKGTMGEAWGLANPRSGRHEPRNVMYCGNTSQDIGGCAMRLVSAAPLPMLPYGDPGMIEAT